MNKNPWKIFGVEKNEKNKTERKRCDNFGGKKLS